MAVPILPVQAWVKRIGGERVQVVALIPPGQSMHTFDPSPRLLTEIDGCEMFFTLSLPFERRLVERSQSRSKPPTVVDLRQGVQLRSIDVPCVHETDDPNHRHEPQAGEKDPHIWVSPKIAARICSTIGQALIERDPAHRDEYARNLAALQAELVAVHDELATRLAAVRGATMLVYHPDFGYFCDEYGIRQMPVELDGREPTPRELAVLAERAKAVGARAIFVQPQYSRKSADALAARIGAAVVVIDPLAADYSGTLRQLGEALAANVAASQP